MVTAKLTKQSERALQIKLRSIELDGETATDTVFAAAEPILVIMESKTPIDTGALINSEEIFVIAEGLVGIGPDMPYERYVEFGTERMRAQPYVRPAYDEGRGQALDVIKELLRADIRRNAKQRA